MSINCLARHRLVLLDYPATGSNRWGQLRVGLLATGESKGLFFIKVSTLYKKKKEKEKEKSTECNLVILLKSYSLQPFLFEGESGFGG